MWSLGVHFVGRCGLLALWLVLCGGLLFLSCTEQDTPPNKRNPPNRRELPPPSCEGEGGRQRSPNPRQLSRSSGREQPGMVLLRSSTSMVMAKKRSSAPCTMYLCWDAQGKELAKIKHNVHHHGRVYAPGVVADLDGDGIFEIVVGDQNARWLPMNIAMVS